MEELNTQGTADATDVVCYTLYRPLYRTESRLNLPVWVGFWW